MTGGCRSRWRPGERLCKVDARLFQGWCSWNFDISATSYAVAEEGSLTLAAAQRLHTAQPSLSRQIHDLERRWGFSCYSGAARRRTDPIGNVFLDHARLVLLQVETAVEAARRAAEPGETSFAMGFLTGHEMDWFPAAIHMLRAEVPDIDVTLTSQSTTARPCNRTAPREDRRGVPAPRGAAGWARLSPPDRRAAGGNPARRPPTRGREPDPAGGSGPLRLRLADPHGAGAEAGDRRVPHGQAGITLTPTYVADNLSSVASLVTSTGGVALLPAYAESLMPPSVVVRRLAGEAPTIELVIGTNKANTSPLLKFLLSKVEDLKFRVSALQSS